jgi:hypothetical protein
MKLAWKNWSSGGKVIFVAGCLAVMSILMKWVDVGIASQTGLSQGAFLFLCFWIYPLLMLFKNKAISRLWGLTCSILSVVVTIVYISSKSVELLGKTVNVAATGAWLFLLASIALIFGVLKYSSAKATIVPETKRCPYCAEEIKVKALICRYCGREQSQEEDRREYEKIDSPILCPDEHYAESGKDFANKAEACINNNGLVTDMKSRCPKCGNERTSEDEECPKCGVIYKKAEAFFNKKRAVKDESTGSPKYKKTSKKKAIKPKTRFFALGCVTIIMIIALIGFIGNMANNNSGINNGFRGIEWGTNIKTLDGMIPKLAPSKFDEFGKPKDEERVHREKIQFLVGKYFWGNIFTKESDILRIKGIDVKQIDYNFWAWGLHGVSIDFSCDHYDEILLLHENEYGKFNQSEVSPNRLEKTYENVEIKIYRNQTVKPCEASLSYCYLPLMEKKRKAMKEYLRSDQEEKEKVK